MDAQEFNKLYDERVAYKLLDIGFIRKNNNMFYIKDKSILSLIRVGYRGLRVARFMLCIRHSFIRDIDTLNIDEANLFLTNPNSYPFKVHPSQFTQKALKKWKYKTNYIGIDGYSYEEINYKQGSYEFLTTEEIEKKLDSICYNTSNFGIQWLDDLSPKESLKQLEKYNCKDKIELMWIDDYRAYLS